MVHAYPSLLINLLAFLYNLFGYKLIVLKLFGWTLFLINDLLLFSIIKKVTDKINPALLGVALYILVQPVLDGNMVWPDLVLITPILFATWSLLNKKYLFAGIFLGLALLVKQTAVFYIAGSCFYILLLEKNKIINLVKIIFGVLVLSLPFISNLFFQHSFLDFINWTIIYPSKYWTKFPGYVELSPTLKENAILLVLFLPLAFLILKANKKIFTDKPFLLLFGFLLCGMLGVYPRFSFFHFQPALVFLVILLTVVFQYVDIKESFLTPFYIALVILIVVLMHNSIVIGGDRFWDKSDLNLAKVIQDKTPSGKPTYLLGFNSNLYAFAGRLPNKPWADNFGWYLEIPGVQEEIVKSLSKDMPSAIFWRTPDPGNWYDLGAYQPQLITNWIKTNYNRVAEVQPGIWEWTQKNQK